MAKRTKLYRSIEGAQFALDAATIKWTMLHFPTVDPAATYEVFKDKALAAAWIYADWRAAWRNYLRNSKQYGGVVYNTGQSDPAFHNLILEARAAGFRDPHPADTAGSYRTAFTQWQNRLPAVNSELRQRIIALPIKRMPS